MGASTHFAIRMVLGFALVHVLWLYPVYLPVAAVSVVVFCLQLYAPGIFRAAAWREIAAGRKGNCGARPLFLRSFQFSVFARPDKSTVTTIRLGAVGDCPKEDSQRGAIPGPKGVFPGRFDDNYCAHDGPEPCDVLPRRRSARALAWCCDLPVLDVLGRGFTTSRARIGNFHGGWRVTVSRIASCFDPTNARERRGTIPLLEVRK